MKHLGSLKGYIDRFVGIGGSSAGPVAEAPPVSLREIFRRFWPYARPYRRWMPLILVLLAVAPAVEAGTIWLFKLLVDQVLVPRDFGPLPWIVGAYIAITLFGGIVSFFDDYLTEWVGSGFLLSLRKTFFEHLHGLSQSFFERRKLGDVISRLSADLAAIETLLLTGLASALSSVIRLVVFIGVLFFLQWKLALVSMFVVPLFYLTAHYFSRKIKVASRERRRRSGSIGAVAEESLSNIALSQAYNRREHEVERFDRENRANFTAKMTATRLKATFSPLIDLIELAGRLVVILFGAWLLVRGELTLGGLLAFLALLSKLYSPVRKLAGLINIFFSASAGAERVIEFLDEKPSVREWERAYPMGNAYGLVQFEGASFRYPGTEKDALSEISFRAEPGETIALVGGSGAGKSTAAKLLLRFYDPSAGKVLVDGHDIRDLTIESLRENVTVLLQETLIFDGTVRENIAYGKPGATEEEIIRAAEAADAHAFIQELPEGYDTMMGQKGRLLSGGQRQRIAIARAMIRDAAVLILDEPTTGLDAASGWRVMEPLKRLMEGRTTIVISHNLSTVSDADRVLVLEEGRLAECGTHDELLSRDGEYARLYRLHGSPDATEAATTLKES